MDTDYRLIAEAPFEIELDEAERSGFSTVQERALTLLRRENRLGIAMKPAVRLSSDSVAKGRAAYDVALMMVVHAHPECRFDWARLVVDLSVTPEAVIEDMAPCEVEEVPVEIETHVGVGLKFTTSIAAANLELKPELSRKQTVFFPTVTASGTGFHKACWDFQAVGDSYLHANRELRLLASARGGESLRAMFLVQARARMKGIRSLIPMTARLGQMAAGIELAPAADDGEAGLDAATS
ncbi:hypothetical protein AB0A73_04290 [Glycomyces sp. NPDC047369]